MINFSARVSLDQEKSTEKGSKKSSEKTTLKTTLKILEILDSNPLISLPEVAGELGITLGAVKKHILNLKKQGKIERIGPDNGGYWKVIN